MLTNNDSYQHRTNSKIKFIIDLIYKSSLYNSLSYPLFRKLAVISGAGISGLASSLQLIKRGYRVIITEKRSDFTRFNIINLDIDAQRFLKEFNLLDEFENEVAGKIKYHKYVLSTAAGMQHLGTSYVTQLQASEIPFEVDYFDRLFNNDGVYSVKIRDLQKFLAKKALDAGVHILGNVETKIQDDNKVLISGQYEENELQPDIFLIAEGANSNTANQQGLLKTEVINECTGENWIFGNFGYSGTESFVVSVIDTSTDKLEIANIIFNAKVHEINVAITSRANLSQKKIARRILDIVNKVLALQNIEETPELIATVENPVRIKNEIRQNFSKDSVFCIGDTAGHSSPLAGMGGTLGLTLVPKSIDKLVTDYETDNPHMHENFDRATEASVNRWINKSASIKLRCLGIFAKQKSVECEDLISTQNMVKL